MFANGQFLLISLGLFLVLAWFFSFERKRGRRIIFAASRDKLDELVSVVINFLTLKINYLGRHIIKMSWYYSLHRFLRIILSILVKSYDFLEVLFTQNKDKAKSLKQEKRFIDRGGHWNQMADHKQATSLNKSQKKKLLKKKLENA